MQEDIIINKVANSGLITLDLEQYYHSGERVVYDIAGNLFHGLILKEKDFREFLKQHDWRQYQDKNVAIICSADAIVPTWAYMLLAAQLESYAHLFVFGNLEMLESVIFQQALSKINIDEYKDNRVVIKGCSNVPVPVYAYVEIVRLLKPHVRSIMYGEPCSTVPVYKKK